MKAGSDSNLSIDSVSNKSDGIDDALNFDKRKVYTGVTLFIGKKLENRYDLDKFIQDDTNQEKIRLKSGCGVIQSFMLNNILTAPGFLKD